MKLYCVLLLTLPLLCHSYPAAEEKSLSLEDTDVDNDHGESVKDSQISKRSGSFDYVTHLKSGLLSSIGHASASIASGSSGGSSGHESYKSHDVVVHGNSVEYDPWSFKKSVLNTIFQAVKAITGGVTALKGQLIKGSGYALSASGNLVAASGDKVTDVGKAIINSAHLNSHTYGTSHGSGTTYVHPFTKISSLSGASSGGSSSKGHAPPHSVHTETITTYEIPTGHANYGPPSKPPSYSSATHQYLPPSGGGAPFSHGHAVSFEAPPSNYVPSGYGQENSPPPEDFNIYGRHKKLNDEEARKAAAQLQEILSMLPDGKTEYTASKTVTLDTSLPTGAHFIPEQIDLPDSYSIPSNSYGLPAHLGPLESLSHTESITAAYAPLAGPTPPKHLEYNVGDIYHQMAKKQTAEEIYLQKHPHEGYDYPPTTHDKVQPHNEYKLENYHASKSTALKDLTPIIAALEVAKRKNHNGGNGGNNPNINYAVEKNIHKISPYKFLPPVIQKSKYTFNNPGPVAAKYEFNHRPNYSGSYKVRRHVGGNGSQKRIGDGAQQKLFRPQDYEIQDPLMFNRLLESTFLKLLASASGGCFALTPLTPLGQFPLFEHRWECNVDTKSA